MLSSDNKRIVQNAGMLYVRMLFLLFTTLYTSRVILNSLGVVDYGIQNVVAGIITLFSFLNASMSTATQRYLTFTLGTGNQEELKRIFSTSFIIHIGIALFLWAIAESIGIWFVNHQLNVPPSRLEAANWIFQFSMLSMALTIVQVPFNTLLIAHERMNIYAYMSIFEVLAKLFIAYAISWFHGDRLILYGFLLFVQTGISISIYVIYCSSNFEECCIRLHYCQRNLFKQITSFAGWNLFGSIAWIFKNQGGNIVLNLFFGPTVNAAYGIAFQVTNAIKSFVGNVQMAFNPQITKKYAENKRDQMIGLIFQSSKYSFLLLLFLSLPVFIQTDFILHLWLKQVPDYAVVFTQLVILEALVDTLSGPMITGLMATGKIKMYQIIVGSLLIIPLGISIVLLKLGFGATTLFWVSILFTCISIVARCLFGKLQFTLSVKRYMQLVIFRCAYVAIPSCLLTYFITISGLMGWPLFFATGTCSSISILFFTYRLGLEQEERLAIQNLLIKFVLKRKHP